MARRVIAFVLALLLTPALTALPERPCAGDLAVAGQKASRTTDHADHRMPAMPGHSGQHGPCDGSGGTDCCPAMAGCAAAGIPSGVTYAAASMMQPGARIVVTTDIPIGHSLAPEPPPPKA